MVLDGHSLAFRAFFSRRAENFRTSNGFYTNAVHGFLSMLIAMVKREKPTHIAVAFDLSRHSFRTDIYPDYKGGRGETPVEFRGQVEYIQRFLDALGIKWLTMENIEADDILATLVALGKSNGMRVLVSSGDRDTFQLIDENVTVLYPAHSFSQTSRMTPQAVKDKYAVWPAQYPELAALVGEKADNLAGVPLVGEKIAAAWINQYGGLDQLLAHRDEITGKRGENLRAHVADVERNRRLNRLRDDLHLPISLEDLRWNGFAAGAVDGICDELEFDEMRRQLQVFSGQVRQLRDEGGDGMAASKAPSGGGEPGESSAGSCGGADAREAGGFGVEPRPLFHVLGRDFSAEDFRVWLRDPAGGGTRGAYGIWALGRLEVNEPRIDALFIARQPQEVILVLPRLLDAGAENLVRDFFATEDRVRVVYDAKALRHGLRAQGWELGSTFRDVNLLDYLADPDEPRSRFASVTDRLLGWSVDEKPSDVEKLCEWMSVAADFSGGGVASSWPQTLVNQGKYALGLLAMLPILEEKVAFRRVGKLLEMEIPLSFLLSKMERAGIGVDQELLFVFDKELSFEVRRTEEAAFASIGREVNLASPKQLQEVLFHQLGLPPTRKNKTGYTTDAKALEELAVYSPHPFLQALLYYRDRSKLLQIVRNLEEKVAADGRIHTTFGQTVAATGRLSSIDPNLQNIPAHTVDGARIREGFVAQAPFEGLMSADYSQIEMRIMAHLSGDEGLIAAFKSGEDLHRSVAALVFGVDSSEVTSVQRSQVKATSYGLAYGLSAFGLASQLRISNSEAKRLMEAYFSRFGKVREYLERVVSEARSVGYTETMWGRRRYLPGLRSSRHQVAENARRAALNAPIQGSAADLMKLAMLQVDGALREARLRSRILLQIHDELIFEVAPREFEVLRDLVVEAMTTVADLRVPLEVSVGVGPNWRAAAH